MDTWKWIGFNAFMLLMLLLDLFVFHRKSKVVSIRNAIAWTLGWITLALVFNYGVYHFYGREKALEFLTGYLIEKSLSVDNIFVFLLIFSYFRIPPAYQHKVLFWGILGALLMRLLFIFAGVALIERFHWVIYVFAAFLVFTGVRLFVRKEDDKDLGESTLMRFFKKVLPVSHTTENDHFFERKNARTYVTPLFLCLLMIEVSDLIFALDSIPAILAVTTDTFIVYTSNVFAILGLRSLYFAVAGLHSYFHHLKYGLSLILIFVGVKICLTDIYKIPTGLALGVIAGILVITMLSSVYMKKRMKK